MINVIGLGYIGLPTILTLAAAGNRVVGTDTDINRVKMLQKGIIPFEEKGMKDLMELAQANDIEFTDEYQNTDIYIITVPSPYDEQTKKVDPSYIIDSTRTVLEKANDDAIVVIESTVSPGTIDKNVRPLIDNHMNETGETVHLVHAPERILPGNMVHELKHNARTVGCDSKEIGEKIKSIYETFCDNEITITDIKSAEMSKVVENTYRDVNIAFANELLKICEVDGLDIYEIIKIANKHPRVNILNPGPGVGGHCISVDPWFLVGDYPRETEIISKARKINDSMPSFTLNRIYEIMQENNISDPSKVGLYGLTYKANVDDIRESPTLQLLEHQRKNLATELMTYDPMVTEDNISTNQVTDFESFVESTELIVVMVGHNHIIENQSKLSNKIVLDTQNIFDDANNIYKLI